MSIKDTHRAALHCKLHLETNCLEGEKKSLSCEIFKVSVVCECVYFEVVSCNTPLSEGRRVSIGMITWAQKCRACLSLCAKVE